jgi:hypothetical protein
MDHKKECPNRPGKGQKEREDKHSHLSIFPALRQSLVALAVRLVLCGLLPARCAFWLINQGRR